MSIILDDEDENSEIPKSQPAKDFKKDRKETQGKKNQSGQSGQNRRAYQFDYLKYVEES